MSKTEIAWAAGFVDGEGSIGGAWKKHPNWKKIAIFVGNTDLGALLYLQDLFGGHVSKPYRSGSWGRKPFRMWCISGKAALSALTKLLPYLQVKHKRAKEVIRAYSR